MIKIEQQKRALIEEQEACRKLYAEKNVMYDGSFYKIDIKASYYDIRRKFERLRALMKEGTVESIDPMLVDGLVDTLRDLSNYANMTVTKILKKEGCE